MRDYFKSRGQQMLDLWVVMTEQYVHLYSTLCCQNVACRTSSIKHHFETTQEKYFADDLKKNETFKKAVSCYEKQSSILKK